MDEAFASDARLDKRALKALSQRSDLKGLLQLASHLGALAVTGSLIHLSLGSLLVIPALWLHGVVLVFLFAALHETVHWTPFRTRVINDIVASACGAVLMLPARYFRAFHFAHHRYTQDPERDPELAAPKSSSLARYALYATGWLYWKDRLTTIPRHALGQVTESFVPPAQRRTVILEARLHLAVYAAILVGSWLAGSWAALHYWLLPALLGQPALRLYLLAEHTGCPFVPDMFRNTRTTLSTPLVRWLAWNMPYHVEHHAFPALPFHALPKAHPLIRDKIAFLASGYGAVHREILRGIGDHPAGQDPAQRMGNPSP